MDRVHFPKGLLSLSLHLFLCFDQAGNSVSHLFLLLCSCSLAGLKLRLQLVPFLSQVVNLSVESILLLAHIFLKILPPLLHLLILRTLVLLNSLDLLKEHVSESLMELDSVLLTSHLLILQFLKHSVLRLKNTFLNSRMLFSLF
jgi:hypothetical protein